MSSLGKEKFMSNDYTATDEVYKSKSIASTGVRNPLEYVPHVIGHELGHAFGFSHSGYLLCDNFYYYDPEWQSGIWQSL